MRWRPGDHDGLRSPTERNANTNHLVASKRTSTIQERTLNDLELVGSPWRSSHGPRVGTRRRRPPSSLGVAVLPRPAQIVAERVAVGLMPNVRPDEAYFDERRLSIFKAAPGERDD